MLLFISTSKRLLQKMETPDINAMIAPPLAPLLLEAENRQKDVSL